MADLAELPELRLKVRVHGRHPWFFRKMVRRPEPPIPPGAAVRVVDREGRRVGIGYWNPRTELSLRLLAHGDVEDPDALLRERVLAAAELRDGRLDLPRVTDGYRLVHAEGDGVPGLVLDRLGDVLVAQVFSLCIEQRLEEIGRDLKERYPGTRLALTVDDTARKREGLRAAPPVRGVSTTVVEHDIRYHVEAGAGHKTGFFADQRENRLRIRELAKGRRVLDACCNSGGFAMNAAKGGARSVVAVDLDETQVEVATENAARNRLAITAEHADAFGFLRDARRGQFDLVVLDPPKWAAGKGAVEAGIERYTDLNRLAFEKLAPGALLLTCSCSGAVSEARFQAAVRDAAAHAGRDARILGAFGAGPDHPVALECPETRYLKVLLLEVRS